MLYGIGQLKRFRKLFLTFDFIKEILKLVLFETPGEDAVVVVLNYLIFVIIIIINKQIT